MENEIGHRSKIILEAGRISIALIIHSLDRRKSLSGITIALLVQSFDRSLFGRLGLSLQSAKQSLNLEKRNF